MARRPQPYSPPFPLVQAMQAGQWARAEEMLRKLLKTSQPHPQMLLDFGRVLAARDKHEEALKFLKRAAKKDPANPLCHFEAGLSAMRLRQWREARQAFGAAMKLAPGEAVIALNLATVLMETAEHAQAAQLLRQALAAAGLSDEQVLYARTLLVEALRECGDLDAMRREARVLGNAHPKSRGAILNLLTKGTHGRIPLAAATLFAEEA